MTTNESKHTPSFRWVIVPNSMRSDGVFICRSEKVRTVTTGFGEQYDSPAGSSIAPSQVHPGTAGLIVEEHNKGIDATAAERDRLRELCGKLAWACAEALPYLETTAEELAENSDSDDSGPLADQLRAALAAAKAEGVS